MRTKIIAGNLIAVLLVGLVSYFLVSSQIERAFLDEVDTEIGHDQQIFDDGWRLSGLELVEQVAQQASEESTRDVFAALGEASQRDRAFRRATTTADWFGRRRRSSPEVAVITNDRGAVVARSQDRNRMFNEDLTRQLETLAGVLRTGEPAIDVWQFSAGQPKLLQTAIAPIRDRDGGIIGSLIVGYDMSNGMAARAGAPLGRDVAFFDGERVYSASVSADRMADLQAALFGAQEGATRAALADEGRVSDPWLSEIGDEQYVGVSAPLPLSPSTAVGSVVLANRTAQGKKGEATIWILVMTGLGLIIVLVYGFLVGTSFLKPVEEMEEGVLAVINGRTDLRLDIESSEFGGLAYRINQLLNVFTGTPEEDSEGRVSSPPEAWGNDDAAVSNPGGSSPGAGAGASGGDVDEAELAAQLATEPEDVYYARIFDEYVAAKEGAGENVSNITQDKFVQRLQANEKSLVKKHECRMVRFQVQVNGSQVNLRPVIIH